MIQIRKGELLSRDKGRNRRFGIRRVTGWTLLEDRGEKSPPHREDLAKAMTLMGPGEQVAIGGD
jgi:hypothetical protein